MSPCSTTRRNVVAQTRGSANPSRSQGWRRNSRANARASPSTAGISMRSGRQPGGDVKAGKDFFQISRGAQQQRRNACRDQEGQDKADGFSEQPDCPQRQHGDQRAAGQVVPFCVEFTELQAEILHVGLFLHTDKLYLKQGRLSTEFRKRIPSLSAQWEKNRKNDGKRMGVAGIL